MDTEQAEKPANDPATDARVVRFAEQLGAELRESFWQTMRTTADKYYHGSKAQA